MECAQDQGKNTNAFAAYTALDAQRLHSLKMDGKFIPLVLTFAPEVKTTWRKLVLFFLAECGGCATLEQLYELATDHPKIAGNPNWKAKVRQIVQREARRIGPALWQQTSLI